VFHRYDFVVASDRSLATTIFIGVVVMASGCALAVQAPNPDRPRDEVPKCDTGKGLVAADGLMASLLGISSIGAFSGDETGTGIALAAASALFVASAMRGNNAANACRGAYEEYNVHLMNERRTEQQVAAAQRTAPRPAVKKKPKPAEPVVAEQPPTKPNVEATGPEGESLDPTTTAPPEYASPRPPIVKSPVPLKPQPQPPAATKAPEKKKPAPPPDEDDWSNFWKEAP
jgi:hypothetical protein